MSNAFLTPVGAEIVMPERSTIAAHPAGWVASSPGGIEVFDRTLSRSLFVAAFEGYGSSTVSDQLDYAAISLRDRAQLRRRDGSVAAEFVHDGWPDWGTGSAYWDSVSEIFAFTVPGSVSDEWCFARAGKVIASVELTDLTAGGSHVSRTRTGHLGLSMGAGQDGCAVYWVEPGSLGNPVVYDEEVVLDLGRSDVLVTMSHEGDVLHLRRLVESSPFASIRSDTIDPGIGEYEPFHWVVSAPDRLVVCVGVDEQAIFVSGVDDLGAWTRLGHPAGLGPDSVLVSGSDGLCVSYDWPSGVVRRWQGPHAA